MEITDRADLATLAVSSHSINEILEKRASPSSIDDDSFPREA
jgi:hypothetical protein